MLHARGKQYSVPSYLICNNFFSISGQQVNYLPCNTSPPVFSQKIHQLLVIVQGIFQGTILLQFALYQTTQAAIPTITSTFWYNNRFRLTSRK